MAKTIEGIKLPSRLVRPRVELKGIPVSPGIVIGRAYLVDRRKVKPPEQIIEPEQVEGEISRFHAAIEESRDQLLAVKKHYEANNVGDYGYLVDVNLLMLKDNMLVKETERIIKDELHSADWALWQVIGKIKELFGGIDDEYFSDRQNDIDHLGERILRNLVGLRVKMIKDISEDVIVVAHDLSPMDTAQMDVKMVKGFVTDLGGRTSHTAILARALGIPATVGLEHVTDVVTGGDQMILDGISGTIIINPTGEEVTLYRERDKQYKEFLKELDSYSGLPARTLDGVNIKVCANVELIEEIKTIKRYGAEGIGLYRTEFLYLNRDELPTEEEHYETYLKFAEAVAPERLTIRTLDLGGDKVAHSVPLEEEANPALGLRSIRLCLKEPEIFKTQLRGILRAGVKKNIRVMFPMVSGVWELNQALALLEEAKAELRERGDIFNDDMDVGVMIEVPSAALMADKICEKVDFLSIGTNDLIQYALAIDRVNEHVAYLYEPLHPAVLRLIKISADAARSAGIPIAVCGEMAGDELYTLILLGLGIEELSMHSVSIPKIKRVLSLASMEEAREISAEVLKMATATEVHDFVEDHLKQKFPGLLDPLQ
ncbi:MAG: phosphoenolpyruvate--protein phosphotransferase [Deltaproteobacteria bacterium]|nr:MAG: phosphoenolpyruvate--protein phosphotransferase [Deltaproteobacteria bacterium]